MSRANTFIKIPKERVGVVIGPEGRTKKSIEDKLSVELQIDGEAGDVNIVMKEGATDPSMLFSAKDVVTALGRGFCRDLSASGSHRSGHSIYSHLFGLERHGQRGASWRGAGTRGERDHR